MQELSGYGLRRALIAGAQRVISQRDELNRINVFPVADGDTGTNMAFTLAAVLNAVRKGRAGHAGEVMRRAASEAIDGARGNSGAILAQFLQGVSEGVAGCRTLTPARLADATSTGSRLAREALAEPREGTILSVISAFAAELQRAVANGSRDFGSSFAAALARARRALDDTPQQLAVLRNAGVVDAGALGFVDMLEGIDEFIRTGRHSPRDEPAADAGEAGVEMPSSPHGDEEIHRWCTECTVSGEAVDRLALKATLLSLPLTSLVLAGTREKVRVHAHVDAPALLFEACARHGTVSSEKADDMRRQFATAHQPRERVAIVVDSGADVPAEALERLDIHVVPVRISIGARDYLDKVSLSPREFYRELRDSPVHPRTSQPPPGDFRRLFEFLLSHHRDLVYVGLSRALSGTLQSGESAAARVDAAHARVVDTNHGSVAQALLAIDAAEAAAAGYSADEIIARVRAGSRSAALFAVVRDLSYGVRGGRAPKLVVPLARWTRCVPIVRSTPSGKLGFGGVLWGRRDVPRRFAAAVARGLDPTRSYRIIVGHCDAAEDAAVLTEELGRRVAKLERIWTIEAGSAIGAHAGPGSLLVGVMPYVPLREGLRA
ncbi:MAG TPA: DegV family protein [Xanthomonadales bacterium]|nr:DegV family protein [Xanthomonadales bacterium]